MKVGDLVVTNSGTRHHGAIGVVIEIELPRNTVGYASTVVRVAYPETGETVKWSNRELVVVS